MSLEFFSGLALVTVTIGVIGYIVKELFDIGFGDLKRTLPQLVAAYRRNAAREAKPVNSHLVGVVGEVTGHSGDSERPMRVRLNFESWPARSGSAADSLAPVGAAVRVIEVAGAVLVVEIVEAEGR